MYTKVCKYPRCGKTFTTEARNAAYCCDECREKYYKERKKRRIEYQKNALSNSIVSKAYVLANQVADLFYPKLECAVCHGISEHVHHKDGNVLNNEPTNLVRLCEKCHKKEHSSMPRVNMVTLLTSCLEMRDNQFVDIIKIYRSGLGKD